MDYQEIIAGTVGKENTYGTVLGAWQAKDFTYLRVSTDDGERPYRAPTWARASSPTTRC